MHLNNLTLINYRNYVKGEIEFGDGVNLIYGANAAGKTNILEAIYLMSTGRSHKNAATKDMVRFGQSYGGFAGNVYALNKHNRYEFALYPDKNCGIKINGVDIKRISELIGKFDSVMFQPDDLRLIKGSPGDRRKFIDLSISRMNSSYFNTLIQYSKVLDNRNKLLKMKKRGDDLSVWNEMLVRDAVEIFAVRHEYVQRLEKRVQKLHEGLRTEQVQLQYKSGIINQEPPPSKDELAAIFLRQLEEEEANKFIDTTRHGPHRDDFVALINGVDAKAYASQGQQRTLVTSLKIAEVKELAESKNAPPVLLLDDVFSELDDYRRNYIISNITDIQVIITSTHPDLSIDNVNKIDIKDVHQ